MCPREGFSLIELIVVMTIISILAAVLTPYMIKTLDSRAKEVGVINAVRAIQTALEMYASGRTDNATYPVDVDIITATVNSLANLVSPAIINPFNNKRYLEVVKEDNNKFYLSTDTATIIPGLIIYEVSPDGKSYTLTPYGADANVIYRLILTGGR